MECNIGGKALKRNVLKGKRLDLIRHDMAVHRIGDDMDVTKFEEKAWRRIEPTRNG